MWSCTLKELIFAVSLFGLMISMFAVWTIGFSQPVASITDFESRDKYRGKVYPVVMELFTSQGCSSCPAADDLLGTLATEGKILGAEIIPLSFHVDYWDRLGWKDSYSDAAFSVRQRDYANLFQQHNYTPQIVVDGSTEFVGSNRTKALRAIEKSRRLPKIDLNLAVLKKGDTISFNVTAPDELPNDGDYELVTLVTLDHVKDVVTAGENRGRTLEHYSVVVFMNQTDLMTGGSKLKAELNFPATIVPREKGNAHVVVLLQNKSTLQIAGAARVPLANFYK